MILHDVIPHHHDHTGLAFFSQFFSNHDHLHFHDVEHGHQHHDHDKSDRDKKHPFHKHLAGTDDYLLARNSYGKNIQTYDQFASLIEFFNYEPPVYYSSKGDLPFDFCFSAISNLYGAVSLRAPPINY
jgi:hypothetical protein